MNKITYAWKEFADATPFEFRCDLTFKKSRRIYNKKHNAYYWEKLTPELAENNITIILDRLNRRVFKNAYRRHKKQLFSLPVIEKNKDDRLHTHILLSKPDFIDDDTFIKLIDDVCDCAPFAYHERNIERIHNKKASLSYNLKTDCDAIDLKNTYLQTNR